MDDIDAEKRIINKYTFDDIWNADGPIKSPYKNLKHTSMKREIKFRAFDKSNNKMVFPNAFLIITGDEVLKLNPHHEENNYYQLENCEERFIIMQFTGLQDKNGKDIYEGDVIQDNFGTGRVEWWQKNCAFRIYFDNGGYKWFTDYLYSELSFIEVIGNLHQ